MVLAGDRLIHPAVRTPVGSGRSGPTSSVCSGVGLEPCLGPTRDRPPSRFVLALAIRAHVVLLISLGNIFSNLLLRRFIHGLCRRFGCCWCHLLLGSATKAKKTSTTLALIFLVCVATCFTLAASIIGGIVIVIIDKGANLLDFSHVGSHIEQHLGEVGMSVLVIVLSVIGGVIGLHHPLPCLQESLQEKRPTTPSGNGVRYRGLSTAALLGNALERSTEDEEGNDRGNGTGEDDDAKQDSILLRSRHVVQTKGGEEIVEGGNRRQDGTERILELVEVVRLGVDRGRHVLAVSDG